MSFLAALLVLVHSLLAGAFTGPTPAPHGVTVSPAAPAPAVVAPPAVAARPAPRPAPRPALPPPAAPVTVAPAPAPAPEPTCVPGEQWQDELGCVATQLPEETVGRAYG